MHFSLATTIFSLAVFAAAIHTGKPVVRNHGIAIKLIKHTPKFTDPDNTVDVDVLDAHVSSLRAKVLRSFDNYEKNTGTTHPYAMNRSGIRERWAGTPLTDDREKTWYGELSVGTPPQTFSVEIDTASSDTFLPWHLCDDTCNGHKLWDTDESSTAKMLANGFSILYMDGSRVTGMQYVDNVTVGGFTAEKQIIGAAMSYSTQFQKAKWAPDGLLGMAFESLSRYHAKPFFTTLVDESKVIEPVFSVKLASDGGELYLGGVNHDLYQGEFTYTPVTVQAEWQVEIQSIQDGKGNVPLTSVPAIIDTDTNYIVGDPTRVSNMYNAFGGTYVGKGFYCFPCDSFPAISLSFNGKSFEIPPKFLNLGRVSLNSDKCFSSIFAKDVDASFWVVGSTFLRGYYTTFDFGTNGGDSRVGFAELRLA